MSDDRPGRRPGDDPAGRAAERRAWDARLSEPGSPVCTPDWLALREPADAAARDPELVELLRAHLRTVGPGPLVVRDLGCGTGSMGRWLAPQLAGPQEWYLHDRDPVLLERAATRLPGTAADGSPVTARTAPGDLTALRAADLAGTTLVTASALLDLLSRDEVDALAEACLGAGCAVLLTLSVAGVVVLDPPDELDRAFGAAFDAHQQRLVDGRPLLGPDSGPYALVAFGTRGAAVQCRPSPWRLGSREGALTEEWMRGWIAAACEQEPDLAAHAADYLRRRLAVAAAGGLHVVVGHVDVLALPGDAR
ncbi:MAG: class I SAM-dependent methyltransferase [Pseudonocardiales bacterium]|nr:class I SAM-dependent methyltransferase [Pseudonocardiales bacterium]